MSNYSALSVLMPCPCSEDSKDNFFVKTLRDALRAEGVDVVCDPNEFWKPSRKYDIIHYQWPEAVIYGMGLSRESLSATTWRISQYKKEGMRFAITRHNAKKHYGTSPLWEDLYRIVETSCDIIFHMGRYSRDTMTADHCGAKARHVIIPHHTYPAIDRSIDKNAARRELGLRDKDKVVLAFGGFRSAMKRLRIKNARLIAPRLFSAPIWGRGKVHAYRELQNRLRFLRYGLFLDNCGLVTDKTMSLQFAASDVVLIQRKHILNSGNLPMGFYFGKVVVGPDRGNVGEILKETGNPVFDPDDEESVASAIRDALELTQSGKGLENQAFADANWRPDVVAKGIIAGYASIL